MMQGQQPVIRQADQTILQQTSSIVIKMTDGIQQITPVGKDFSFLINSCNYSGSSTFNYGICCATDNIRSNSRLKSVFYHSAD